MDPYTIRMQSIFTKASVGHGNTVMQPLSVSDTLFQKVLCITIAQYTSSAHTKETYSVASRELVLGLSTFWFSCL